MSYNIETTAVHAGRGDFEALGVHAPPIDLSTTYPCRDLDLATSSLEALAQGASQAPLSFLPTAKNTLG